MKRVLCFFVLVVSVTTAFGQSDDKNPVMIPYRKGNKWGYCDMAKQTMIAAKFDTATFFGAPYAPLNAKPTPEYAFVTQKGKEFWLSRGGRMLDITTKVSAEVTNVGGGDIAAAVMPEVKIVTNPATGLKGAVVNGKDTLVRARYEEIETGLVGSETHVRVKAIGKWGVIETGDVEKWILSPEYDSVELTNMRSGECFLVKDKGHWGLLNPDATILLPVAFNDIQVIAWTADQLLVAKGDKGTDLYNASGKKLTAEPYEAVNIEGFGHFSANMRASVKKNNKWGFVDIRGKEWVPCKYDEVLRECDSDGLSLIKINGRAGVVDAKGTEYFDK